MKISYRNYPILEKLEKGSLGLMPTLDPDQSFFERFGQLFIENWKLHNENFKKEINVISKPFYEGVIKAQKNLKQLWEDILVNDTSDFEVKGCFIQGSFVYMIDYEVRKESPHHEIAMYVFNKEGIPLAMFIDSEKHNIYQTGWISSCFEVNKNRKEITSWLFREFIKIVIFRMFKTYAEVETKIIPPNSKVKGIGCKYVNDTKLNLTHLDSKWFTTLIKSDEFNVRGHFRLQPKKKDGKWTKELIWINEFKKTGYTSPARKLSKK